MIQRQLLVGALVVVVAGLLTWLFWPTGGSGTSVQQAAGRLYQVKLTADDPHMGANTLTIDITPSTVDTVTIAPVMPQMGHALAPVTASAAEPGRYRAETTLPMTGQWEITVSLTGRAGADQVVIPLLVKG